MKNVCKYLVVILAVVFTLHLWATEATEVVAVVASGIGKTEDAALKQAFSNAVTQVVGTIVDAETMVQNDKIITEQILTYSNAIVTKYDPVGKPVTLDGLIKVTIKAQVEKRLLTEKLIAIKVFTAKVDGKDLVARALTELKEEDDGAKILAKIVESHKSYYKLQLYGEPKIWEKTAEKVTMGVRVECSIDEKKYTDWVASVKPLLNKIATKSQGGLVKVPENELDHEIFVVSKERDSGGVYDGLVDDWTLPLKQRSCKNGILFPKEDLIGGKLYRHTYNYWTADRDNRYTKGAFNIIVWDGVGNTRYTQYTIPVSLWEKGVKGVVLPNYEVVLLDGTKQEVSVSPADIYDRCGISMRWMWTDSEPQIKYVGRFFTPYIYFNQLEDRYWNNSGNYMSRRFVKEVMFELPLEKLQGVKSIDIRLLDAKKK